MSITHFHELKEIRERYNNKKIVFCSGSFDLMHPGHILFFEDCRKFGDVLVVMIGNDETMRAYKGSGRPILNQYLRLKAVDSLKCVDYVFLDRYSVEGNLLSDLEIVFSTLRPDFYIINEDAFNIPQREKIVSNFKHVKMEILKRTCPPEFENISTSKIIEKIKKTQG